MSGPSTIKSSTYCSNKEIKIETDGLTGNVTFLAPKISLKKNHNFTAHQNGVVVFATSDEELVLNTNGTTFNGFIFHPGNTTSPTSPCPGLGAGPGSGPGADLDPGASLQTSTVRSSPGDPARRTTTSAPGACLRALVRPSCTVR